jgi:hypothetical protein
MVVALFSGVIIENLHKSEVKIMKKRINSIGKFLNKNFDRIAVCMACAMLMGTTVFAAGGNPSNVDTLWQTIASLVETWVTRLGGVVMLVGGVMFGLGWKSDDAEQKSRGVSTMIAGAIVIAIAALTGTFFA